MMDGWIDDALICRQGLGVTAHTNIVVLWLVLGLPRAVLLKNHKAVVTPPVSNEHLINQ